MKLKIKNKWRLIGGLLLCGLTCTLPVVLTSCSNGSNANTNNEVNYITNGNDLLDRIEKDISKWMLSNGKEEVIKFDFSKNRPNQHIMPSGPQRLGTLSDFANVVPTNKDKSFTIDKFNFNWQWTNPAKPNYSLNNDCYSIEDTGEQTSDGRKIYKATTKLLMPINLYDDEYLGDTTIGVIEIDYNISETWSYLLTEDPTLLPTTTNN